MTISIKKLTTILACAAVLGTAGIAQAAPNHQHQPRSAASHSQRSRAPTPRHARPAPRSQPRRAAPARRHARPAHGYRYQRGGHVPRAWRGSSRVVNNWRSHRRLYQPPRGYQWVRGNNNDMLLVAIATGVIASIVTNAVVY